MNLLRHNQRDDFFRGVIRVLDHGDEGLELHRTTARQLAHLESLNPAWGIRGRCLAGMEVVCRTDATHLEMTLTAQPGARRYLMIAVEIDDITFHPVYELEQADGPLNFILPLIIPETRHTTDGLRTVRIHLPPARPALLKQVTFHGATTIQPLPRPRRRLLALGDSITEGMEAHTPLIAYPTAVARALHMELVNQGIGGHIFDPTFIDGDLPFTPDVITIAYGVNDWGRVPSLDTFKSNVHGCLANLSQAWPQAQLFVLTPIWYGGQPDVRGLGTLPDVRNAITATACASGIKCTIVPGATLVPNESRYYCDGCHPNDLGFGHYALNLLPYLTA